MTCFFDVVFAVVRYAMAHLDAWLFHVFFSLTKHFLATKLEDAWYTAKTVNKSLKDTKYLLTRSPFHKLRDTAR